MKKPIVSMFAGLAILMMAGCSEMDQSSEGSGIDLPLQVSLQDRLHLAPKLAITLLPPSRDFGVKQLQMSIRLSNMTDEDLRLSYKIWFVDAHGATVESPGDWVNLMIPGAEVKELYIQSISVAAKDFRIQFKERH